MADASDARRLDAVFERLKAILEPYAREMYVANDGPDGYSVDMAAVGERNPTSWFGGVRKGKRYVSYYLMPVYVEPSLLDGVSPELRGRMQGKSCFNFTAVNDRLLGELDDLTGRGFELAAGDPNWGRLEAPRVRHDPPQSDGSGEALMADLDAVEARLQRILDPYRDRLEAATIYGMPVLRRPGAKAHDWFAGVQRTASAVKFNFLPMHTNASLLDGAPPALLKRRTGASVFKFATIDEPLLAELEAIVARAFESYAGLT